MAIQLSKSSKSSHQQSCLKRLKVALEPFSGARKYLFRLKRYNMFAPLPFKKGAYCFAPVSRSVYRPSSIHSISFVPLKVAKLGSVDAPRKWITPIDFRSNDHQCENWSLFKCFPLNILWPVCLKVSNFGTVDTRRK